MIGPGFSLVLTLFTAGPAPPALTWRRLFVGKIALAGVALPVVGLALVRAFC